jgi:hypothetical protein
MSRQQRPTAQDLFRKIWNWFVVQGKPLARDGGKGSPCKYRGPSGSKCAVGVCIANTTYKPAMDQIGSIDSVVQLPGLEHLAMHLPMLRELQTLHDFADDAASFRRVLRTFAKRNIYGVHAPVLRSKS